MGYPAKTDDSVFRVADRDCESGSGIVRVSYINDVCIIDLKQCDFRALTLVCDLSEILECREDAQKVIVTKTPGKRHRRLTMHPARVLPLIGRHDFLNRCTHDALPSLLFMGENAFCPNHSGMHRDTPTGIHWRKTPGGVSDGSVPLHGVESYQGTPFVEDPIVDLET